MPLIREAGASIARQALLTRAVGRGTPWRHDHRKTETRMKMSCIPHGLVLAAALALSSSGAFAAAAQHALSETEMSAIYGRGLGDPALSALGALSAQEQGNSAVSATAANDALASLGALSADGARNIDRQMVQQRLQGTTTSLQASLKTMQVLAALNDALAPIVGSRSLPLMPFPLLFTLPALPSLGAIQNKH